MKTITIEIEETGPLSSAVKVSQDKRLTPFECLGIFRYLEKRIWMNIIDSETKPNQEKDVPTRPETPEKGKKETPAPKKAKKPQGKG